jgi:predicted O-linked N-acetylglucosamine transferase (SPINDLY family)
VAPKIFNFFKPKAVKHSPSTADGEGIDAARGLYLQGRYAESLAICRGILEREPDHVDALFLSAEIAAKMGESDRAMETYRQVLHLQPDHVPAHYKRGNLLKDRQQMEAALASYDEAIALDPGYAHAFLNRGFVLERLNQWDAALASYDQAISIDPGDALAHFNRAVVLRVLGRQEEALASYTQAIAVKPDYFEAYCNRGFLLTEMERWDEALASHDKCIEINPGFGPAHCGRGTVLQQRKDWDAALASYDRAIDINPGHAVAHGNRGSLLTELKVWSAARSSLERAITLDPDLAEAHDSLALLLAAVGFPDASLKCFDRAIALKPDSAHAYLNRANLLVQMKRFLPAVASYDRGIALKGNARFVLGMQRYAKMNLCDWSGLPADMQRLASGIEAGEAVSPPLPMLALVDSPPLHRQGAQIWVRELYPARAVLPEIPRRLRPGKIRIGYFSGDFYQHPVAVLMAELFEIHDRSKFEVYAFSYCPDSQDNMRKRLKSAFDRFIDVHGQSDQDIALLAREMDIDIAVDLGGHSGSSRTGIFALRAAPLQIHYLGYPGTMGAQYMDYLIADSTIIPPADRQYYSEKVLYLPSFQANDSKRGIADRVCSREELALPVDGFVFCCFNANYKITPTTFAGWMRILARVPGSVLYLYAENEAVLENLGKEAQSLGVDTKRLIFADKRLAANLAHPEYLARYRVPDLFLDTLPYNAGATASDALWAGLPVLTCLGKAFAGRMAASLLTAIGLPELIAQTQQQYEDLAVALATDPQRLAAIRHKLAANRTIALLFDTRRFAKHLESGYAKILERYHAGLPPEHTEVQA